MKIQFSQVKILLIFAMFFLSLNKSKLLFAQEDIDQDSIAGEPKQAVAGYETYLDEYFFDNSTIKHLPYRDIKTLSLSYPSAYYIQGSNLFLNGLPVSGNYTMLDGMKINDASAFPFRSIGKFAVLNNEVPIQSGNSLGGFIVILTPEAADSFSINIEGASSSPFHSLGNHIMEMNMSGPVRFSKKKKNTKVIPAFYIAASLSTTKDLNPSSAQNYEIDPQTLSDLENNPLSPVSPGFIYSSESITNAQIIETPFKQNAGNKALNTFAKFNFPVHKNINLTMGSYIQLDKRREFIFENALFNSKNNPERIIRNFDNYFRFSHSFKKGNAFNLNSQVQFNYSSHYNKLQNPTHKDNFFNYGYIGKFTQLSKPLYSSDIFGAPLDSLVLADGTTLYGKIEEDIGDVLTGLEFVPGTLNPLATNYTQQLYENTVIITSGDLLGNLGLINGDSPKFIYSLWHNTGSVYNGYALSNENQLSLMALSTANFGSHVIKLGFEYEQKTISSYKLTPLNLWVAARGLLNKHIIPNDINNYSIINSVNTNGDTITYVDYHAVPDTTVEQTIFDNNLRSQLGINDLLQEIYIDELSPDQLSLTLFSANELLQQGFVSYQGYSHTGKKLNNNIAFEDFFKDKINRPQGAFRPVYSGFFIEDKIKIKKLNIRMGLRIDRYDANQKALRDKYSLVKLRSVGETNVSLFDTATYIKPLNVGDDWAIYVNKSSDNYDGSNQGDYLVLGYRDGDVWYDENGEERQNANHVDVTGNVYPWYDLVNDNKNYYPEGRISMEAFEDYKPVINFLPSIDINFNLLHSTMLFFHYSSFTQNPEPFNILIPWQYYYLNRTFTLFLNNPALKPRRIGKIYTGTKCNIYKGITGRISYFRSYLKNDFFIESVYPAYPNTYFTIQNSNSEIINQGLNFSLSAKSFKSQGFNGGINYTRQFLAKKALISDNFVPDIFNSYVQYNFGNGKDYPGRFNNKGKKLLHNAGISFFYHLRTGTPYTRYKNLVPQAFIGNTGQITIIESINEGKSPAYSFFDLKLEKGFSFANNRLKLNMYLWVQNLFNQKKILKVYNYTGAPDDDGYLATIDRDNNPSFYDQYAIKVNNPSYYDNPRIIRIGSIVSF